MNEHILQLFPFVLAGILLGTFIPFGNNAPPVRGIPLPFLNDDADDEILPPGVVYNPTDRSPLLEILIRCMVSLRDAFGMFHALSTTSRSGDSQFPTASADHADARARLLAAAFDQGWAGLEGASNDGMAMLGTLRGRPNKNLATQDEVSYIRCFIMYSLTTILSQRDDAVVSPGVLIDIATTFARSGQNPPIPPAATTLQLDDDDIRFIATSMVIIAGLVTVLISRVEEEPDVRSAFSHFAEDPTSWVRFTHSAAATVPSVEQIVRLTHNSIRSQSRRGSSRTLTVGPPCLSSLGQSKPTAPFRSSVVLAGFNSHTLGYGALPVIDVGAGTETVTLRDEEVEYLAALFIVALMRFHARSTTTASKHAN